jgi:predicted RNA binding protein YcfA (HicA-like mRNA interferase family)
VPEFRDIRPQEAIRALLAAGGVVKPGKGDHVNIKMPNGQIVTLSGLREPVRVGILKAMIRKSGMSEGEFLRLLGRRRR